MYINYQRPYNVQIEVTTKCNAMCPLCPRVDVDNDTRLSPDMPYNKDLELDVFKNFIDQSSPQLVEYIPMYGDPLANDKFLSMIEYSHHYNYKIHTNASLRSTDYFKELAKFSPYDGDSYVSFSIDGLEDTNHIYRRGTSWSKIISNAEAFIKAGGHAQWKFIIFDHNKHQLAEARQLAQKLGFKTFTATPNWGGKFQIHTTPIKQIQAERKIYNKRQDHKKPDHTKIVCEWKNYPKIYLSVFGEVFPCCYLYDEYQASKSFTGSDLVDEFEKYKKGFNSVKLNKLVDILNHPWFKKELEKSWDSNSLKRCLTSCGIKHKTYGLVENL
jgi:MoaA/NifB/PqqE/SkfB family radical SAM enzyme